MLRRIITTVVIVGLVATGCIRDPEYVPSTVTAIGMVQEAVAMYADEGIDAVVDYYNRPDAANGSFYVVITTSDGTTLAHRDQTLVGTIEPGPLTDTGVTVLEATLAVAAGGGGWVSHDYVRPTTGQAGRRHLWVQASDGYVFSCGYYNTKFD